MIAEELNHAAFLLRRSEFGCRGFPLPDRVARYRADSSIRSAQAGTRVSAVTLRPLALEQRFAGNFARKLQILEDVGGLQGLTIRLELDAELPLVDVGQRFGRASDCRYTAT